MLFVIIGLCLGIWALVAMQMNAWGLGEHVIFFILGLFIVGLGAIGGGAVAMAVGYFPGQHATQHERIDLVALQDNVGAEGRFFLGTGYIENKLNYFYYRKDGDAYRADKETADGAVIYQDEISQPYLLTYYSSFNHSFWYFFGFPSKSQRSQFHVPKGSIKENFTLDLN